MKEAAQIPGKVIPPLLNKKLVNNNNGLKQTTSPEEESTPANEDNSPPKKKKPSPKPASWESADLFEATATAAERDVGMLLLKFSEVLRESAAADASQMQQLEGFLAEAADFEAFLKQKKEHLRQTLAGISDKLQC